MNVRTHARTSKAPRGGGKLNGFHDLTASLKRGCLASLDGKSSLRSAGARLASLGGGCLAEGAYEYVLEYRWP